jgi:microcin C transport system substrate-binding protein
MGDAKLMTMTLSAAARASAVAWLRAPFLAALFLAPMLGRPAGAETPVHGLAMHGEVKYKAGFTNFDYVNPNAPKGGLVRLGVYGTFDSLNGFIIRGTPAGMIGLLNDELTVSSNDEAFSQYGLVAESMEVPKDRSWVIFNLRKEARFHDGKPITADDVIFTFNLLLKKGHPFYRFYYSSVAKVEKLGRLRVKFSFKPGQNRELPLIISQLPVLPKHYWEKRDFTKPTLDPPVGSGPYRIESFEAGRRITYVRDKNYWAANLPVMRGRYNFARIRLDYYRDTTVLREALKSGRIDFNEENQAKAWATAYDIPALKAKKLIKLLVPTESGAGMQCFAINSRKPKFSDPRVRRALGYAFDFNYINRTLFFGQYKRTKSYFENSELAARGLPKGKELEILERFRGRVPPEVFTKVYDVPSYKDQRDLRRGLREAFKLLKAAGWVVKDRKLVNAKTGEPMEFEILTQSQEFERILLPFAKNLERLGIRAKVRLVDPSQYEERLRRFDYEITTLTFSESLSPGNEQRNYWSSRAAKTDGSSNYLGVSDKAIDELVELVIAAPDRDSLIARTRALDRVLLWHHYAIPQWYLPAQRLVFWDKFGRPAKPTIRGYDLFTWWVDEKKEAALGSALKSN